MMNILFVCLGNICRSPTVEGVARHLAAREAPHLELGFDSAGTAGYHIGEPPDARAIRHARSRGYDISGLRARQVQREDFHRFDLLLAMDEENLDDLRAIAPHGHEHRARLFLEWCEGVDSLIVPDPYYGGREHFEQVIDLAERGVRSLFRKIEAGGLAPVAGAVAGAIRGR
jgi:protein-tyrosine phosphatase